MTKSLYESIKELNKKTKEALTIVLSHELTGTSEEEMIEILISNYTQDEINYILSRLKKALSIIEA